MAVEAMMLSFDLEEWFHSENFHGVVPRSAWPSLDSRVEESTRLTLDLLDEYHRRATFFILGWVAERHRGLIAEIHRRGHEIASHGYDHELVYRQTPEGFRRDILRTKHILEEIIGQPVFGYRAPVFSITDWAFDLLTEAGYTYDSSLFPVSYHDRYGYAQCEIARSRIQAVRPQLLEVILPTYSLLYLNVPWAGGGYFRLLPYNIFRQGIRAIVRRHETYLFYFHPHELDTEQPRVRLRNPVLRFRQYVGLMGTQRKLRRLLAEYPFTSIAEGLYASGYDVQQGIAALKAA